MISAIDKIIFDTEKITLRKGYIAPSARKTIQMIDIVRSYSHYQFGRIDAFTTTAASFHSE